MRVLECRGGGAKAVIGAIVAVLAMAGVTGGAEQASVARNGENVWIQVAARAEGLLNSQWRTDLGLRNVSTVQANVEVKLYPPGGGAVKSKTTFVPSGAQSVLEDVVGQLGYTGSGAIEVISDQPVIVTSRTYNQITGTATCTPGGTFGQYYAGHTLEQGLTRGESAWLSHLAESSRFRSNLAFTNMGTVAATVRVELFDGAGTLLVTFDVTLNPGQYKQEAQVFGNRAGQTAMQRGSARVMVTAGSGVIASASVVDNITNDPTTIPALRMPAYAAPQPVGYTSFQGEELSLLAYEGRRVAFLVPTDKLHAATVNRIVAAFDDAYDYYHLAAGREPALFRQFNGKGTIAVVPATCGAGCGYLGATGIEILHTSGYSAFETLYIGVLVREQFDQAVFYELGRNFWLFGDRIEYKGDDAKGVVTTGFAVLMRFKSMEAAGVEGGPFRSASFAQFRAEVVGLFASYMANPALDWSNTLRVGQAPANPLGLGATDLFASFVFELEARYGNGFVERVWREVANRPVAATTQDAVDNFVLAACAAVEQDITHVFTQWRWPVSAAAKDEAVRRFG